MKIIIFGLFSILLTVGTTFAGTKLVPHHTAKNGALVHEHHEITPGGESWKDWMKLNTKSSSNKLYREPFGPMRTPAGGGAPAYNNVPNMEDFDSSPFDTN